MIQKCEVFLFTVQHKEFSVLLLHRKPERGDYWQPVTGSRESIDYSLHDTAYREVFEETGVGKDNIASVLPDIYQFSFTHETGKEVFVFEEHCFGFEIIDQTKVTIENNPVDEHDCMQWFTFAEALEKLKWDQNKRALQRLHALLLSE